MKQATLCLLVRDNQVCLAMKKRGFGVGKWNGAGGKVQEDESIEEATKRETLEEIGVNITKYEKVAETTFHFINKPEWGQVVHTYLVTEWEGEPTESEEMAPKWFNLDEIPYDQMWPDDAIWIPMVLKGKKLKGEFTLDGEVLVGEPKIVEVVSF